MMQNGKSITRRRWVAGTAEAAIAAGCSRPRKWAPVSIYRSRSYSDDHHALILRIITDHRLDLRGKRVVLKPNLVEFDEHSVINTNPKLVYAAFETFREAGAVDVRIAEGPGHRRVTLDMADSAGYFSAVPRFESVFTDLNLDEITRVRLRSPKSKLDSLFLPNTVLSCDLVVSMPKLKTHHWVGATLSMKNLFGLVPGGVYGWPKNVLHWAGIDQTIADLHTLFPRAFSIVDGIVGMEGNGPIQGTAKPMGVVVAGADPVAVDATCCRIMCIDPVKVGYLRLSTAYEQLGEKMIPQMGESIASIAQPFALLPGIEHLRVGGRAS